MASTQKSRKPMGQNEVMCLVELVESNPVLTSKETNAYTNKLKEEAWVSLTDTYNAKCGSIPRQKDQLKLKWDNLKKSARKRNQQIRMNNLKTGGGKPDYIPPDEVLERVAGVLGSTCSGFNVPFGGDGSGVILVDEAIDSDLNEITYKEDTIAITIADIPDGECSSPCEAKKRKIEDIHTPKKCLYGMPTMSKPLQHKGKRLIEKETGVFQRNLAIAKYYEKKAEKIDLEIELLRIEIEKKKKEN